MTTDATVLLNAINAGLRPFVRSPVMLAMGLGIALLLSPKLTIAFLIHNAYSDHFAGDHRVQGRPAVRPPAKRCRPPEQPHQESLTAIRAIKAFVRGDCERAVHRHEH